MQGSIRILVLCAFSAASAASANASEVTSTVDGIVVRYSRAELSNTAAAGVLYGKLKSASRKACGLVGGHLNLPERTIALKCYDETLADIVRRIDRPLLTALHESKTAKEG